MGHKTRLALLNTMSISILKEEDNKSGHRYSSQTWARIVSSLVTHGWKPSIQILTGKKEDSLIHR